MLLEISETLKGQENKNELKIWIKIVGLWSLETWTVATTEYIIAVKRHQDIRDINKIWEKNYKRTEINLKWTNVHNEDVILEFNKVHKKSWNGSRSHAYLSSPYSQTMHFLFRLSANKTWYA